MQVLLFAYSNNAQGWVGPSNTGGGFWAEVAPVLYGAALVLCVAALIGWFAIIRPGRGRPPRGGPRRRVPRADATRRARTARAPNR